MQANTTNSEKQNQQTINLSYEELEAVLSKIISSNPNKEDIKSTNETIKHYSKNVLCVEGFFIQIQNNPNFKIRQLAGILLYRKIQKHWPTMAPEVQSKLVEMVISLLQKETNFQVQKAIANLIYKIAKMVLINKEWTSLLDYIFTDPLKYSPEQANLLELNLYIISELIESCAFYLKEKFSEIKKILELAMNQGNQKMKELSTKCLGNLVRGLEKEELIFFKDLIPNIFNEMKNFTEETVLHIYETFCDFHLNSLDFFDAFFDDYIIPYSLEFLQNIEFNENTKLVISEFLLMIAECKRKTFTKNDCKFLKATLEAAFKLACTEEEAEPNVDSELSEFETGMRIIQSMSLTIQSKYFFPLATSYIKNLITSTDPLQRKAGVYSLGSISEGCCEKIKDMLGEVISTLVNIANNDTVKNIRYEAIIAIDQLTQFCEPEINEYHSQIIPMLVKGLESQDEEMITKCLIELNYFCKNLDVELEDYVGELLPRLICLLTNHKSISVQKECLFALASIISSAQNLVNQTLLPILETCRGIIVNRTSEDEIELRANSLDCVAHIAYAIKREKFTPYMEFFTAYAGESIKSDKYELQEAGFTYFGIIATLIGKDITNDMPVLLNRALEILKDDSGVTNTRDADEFGLDSDSEDGKSDDEIEDMYISHGFINAKCAVILAITRFAEASPCAFLGHMQGVFAVFETLWDYINSEVNYELITAYQSILITIGTAESEIIAANNDLSGGNANGNVTNNKDLISLPYKMWTMEVFPKYEKIYQDSDVKEEIVRVLESIYEIINGVGKQLFINNNTLERIITICTGLLGNKATCQIKADDEEDDPDHDEAILGGVVDIYLILSEKLGNDFHDSFTKSFPSFKKYISVKRSERDRSMIIGCIADVLKHCNVSTKFYIDVLVQSCEDNIKKNSKKKYEDLNRHVAYLIGVLFESDGESASKYFEDCLRMLHGLFEVSKTMAKDNVIASLCRIVMGLKMNASNEMFGKIVETICENIPLKHDSLENPLIFKFLQFLSDKIDMKGYELYLENILKTVKMLVLNEIKCGTSKGLLKEVKAYLEMLNTNEVLRVAIENFIGGMDEKERERFVNTVRNA